MTEADRLGPREAPQHIGQHRVVGRLTGLAPKQLKPVQPAEHAPALVKPRSPRGGKQAEAIAGPAVEQEPGIAEIDAVNSARRARAGSEKQAQRVIDDRWCHRRQRGPGVRAPLCHPPSAEAARNWPAGWTWSRISFLRGDAATLGPAPLRETKRKR